MTFRNYKETAPAARILDLVICCFDHDWFDKRSHSLGLAKLREQAEHRFAVVQELWISPVTVDGDMFAEMYCIYPFTVAWMDLRK